MVEWHFAAEHTSSEVEKFLTTGAWRDVAKVVKQNRRRTVFYIEGAEDIPSMFIKVDHSRSLWDRLKHLWRTKSQKEFAAGCALDRAGIRVVDMLAWARDGGESLLVSRELTGACSFPDAWNCCRGLPDRRQVFLKELSSFCRSLLTKGVVHPDLHAGNLLVVLIDGVPGIQFFLVDVYGVHTGQELGESGRNRLFNWLVGLLRSLTVPERAAFLSAALAEGVVDGSDAWWQQLCGFHAREVRRRWRGRRRRLLTTSSLCAAETTKTGRWLLLRPFELATAEETIRLHHLCRESGNGLLKNDTKRVVSRVSVDGQSYVVKDFVKCGSRGPWRPDRRSWLDTHRVNMLPLPVAACVAWLRGRDGHGYLILEDVGDQSLGHSWMVHGRSWEQLRGEVSLVARLAAWLHSSGVVHSDLRPSNMVIGSGGDYPVMQLTLVDTDKITFPRTLTHMHRAKNLVQLIDALPPDCPSLTRVRLLVAYRKFAGLKKQDMRDILGLLPR